MKKKVCVLMSTYNGERYIREQISSILTQKCVDVYLYVRDDGSSDNTKRILSEYEEEGKLRWYSGGNIGPAYSFMDLVFSCSDKFEYYAFSDQDDIWEEVKLNEAIRKLENIKEGASLYHSKVDVVTMSLEGCEKQYGPKCEYNFYTELARNSTIGCTMVFNSILLKELRQYRPKYICMHDQWVHLVCAALDGNIITDSRSFIKYRQHDRNVLGAKIKLKERFKESVFSKKGNGRRLCQAKELYQGYGERMCDKKRFFLECVTRYRVNMIYKIRCIFSDYNCENPMYNILIQFAFLLNKF